MPCVRSWLFMADSPASKTPSASNTRSAAALSSADPRAIPCCEVTPPLGRHPFIHRSGASPDVMD